MALTDDDKQWISEQLERYAARFIEGLESVEAKFSERLESVEARFSERLESVEARFNEKLESVEARFNEKLESVETRLLTEFHKWASPVEMRQRTHSAALRAVDVEMEALADRVTKLENRGEKPA